MIRILSLLLVAVFLVTGCISKRPKSTVSSIKMDPTQGVRVEPEARAAYQASEKLFQAKQYEQALRQYQAVRSKFPRGKAAELSTYRIGSIHYYKEDYQSASREFEGLLRRFPQTTLAFDVNYNWAASEYQLGRYERSEQVLARINDADIQAQGPKRAQVVYELKALNAVALGHHGEAVFNFAEELGLTDNDKRRASLEENINSHLEKANEQELNDLLQRVTEPTTRNKTQQKLALLSIEGNRQIPAPSSKEVEVLERESARPSLGSGSSAERSHVGVVLPLTGKWASLGKRALDGILLASRSFSPGQESGVQLFVEDSASNPVLAERAVERLYGEKRVSAIIGPLNWKESLSVADKSQELGVANLSLTARPGIVQRGPYVFQNALTPRVQLENLVHYSIHDRGYKRFAILAPENPYGRDMAFEFWDLVEKAGGRVVAYETYETDAKDFQPQVQALAGLDNGKYRRFEWGKIQEYIKEQKQKTGKEPRVKLQSIVDFDAIFLPDSPKTVAAIAANLAYFDVSGTGLLGTTEWNSDVLYKRGGKFVELAMFPGVLLPGTRNTVQREFIRSFIEAYGYSPDLLSAQSFEAMQLVAYALQNSSGNRNDVVRALSSVREFPSVIANASIDETRTARRVIPIYALDAQGNTVEQ